MAEFLKLRYKQIIRSLSRRRFWETDGNQKWFRNQKWRHTSQTSGDSLPSLLKQQKRKKISGLYEHWKHCLRYFCRFPEFTGHSTILFHWSKKVFFVSRTCTDDGKVCCRRRGTRVTQSNQICLSNVPPKEQSPSVPGVINKACL